ncbi:MAG: ATP-binding protein [Ignavibacteria bacterium]
MTHLKPDSLSADLMQSGTVTDNTQMNADDGQMRLSLAEMEKQLLRFKCIAANINEFFWSLSYENNTEEIYYSDSIKKITQYTSVEIKELPGGGQALIHSEDTFKIRKVLTEFENNVSQNSLELVYRIVNKKNETVWVKESIAVERNSSGKVTRYDGVVTDVTDIKKKEMAHSEAEEKLRGLNEAKDRFISIISHDLRAPFTSILGFSEILQNETTLTESERAEYLNYIYESSQNQLRMVNYLLDWARLQSGKIKIEPQRLKSRTIVDNCISALTGNAIRKNIQISSRVPEDMFIYADENLITQAITNLLSNAIKFTEVNKSIEVIANRFKKGFYEFIFKDEGIGISEENKRKIFQFDQKFTSDGTRGEKGSGLGLTLVKEIIEKHGGDIWFYSELNHGSEFHFIIPEANNVVLLVEDDIASMNLLKHVIRKVLPGFEITTASNGYEAMSMIPDKIPTLVITDHNMPLMNGIQLIESIRKREESNRVQIIVVAALLTEEQQHKYSQLGVEHILPKPLEVKEFSRMLLEIIN